MEMPQIFKQHHSVNAAFQTACKPMEGTGGSGFIVEMVHLLSVTSTLRFLPDAAASH